MGEEAAKHETLIEDINVQVPSDETRTGYQSSL
jgi:hypothetical protein